MAFSFGTSTPASAPSFTFNSTPAFGTSTPAFGAVSTPAFGAAASAPALSFGAAASSATPFGAASTPSLFGATSTPSLFGATSTPSLFGGAPAPAAASTPSFGFGTGALVTTTATPSLFGAPQGQQQQQQGYAALVTKDNRPLTHTTKWDDLSPQAQQYLLELEKRVVQFREECQQLDGDERLGSLRGGRKEAQADGGIEESARLLAQRITSLGSSLRSDSEACEAVMELVRRMLRNTETALYTFKRTYLWREGLKSTQGQALPSHVMEQLAGPVVLPSHYLREAVAGLRDNLAQYAACAAELEQVLGAAAQQQEAGRLLGGSAGGAVNPADMLQSLQAALTNAHHLLIHTAAKLQALDDKVAQTKEAALAARRQAGDYSDPFAEAERQERNNDGETGGVIDGFSSGGQAGGPVGLGAATQQQSAQPSQPAGGSGFGAAATPFASPSPAPSGLFGTLTPAASMPYGGTGGFGTPLFGSGTTSATVRKGKGKK